MYSRRKRQGNRGALGAPAVPQQVVTSRGRLDRTGVKQRMNNGRSSGGNGYIYPGGAVKDNHSIVTHDVTLMHRYRPVFNRLRNHPNLQVLSSFNGMDYSKYPTQEHVNRAFFFTGIALGKDSFDSTTSDTGLALLIGGVYTINVSGPFAFRPGDEVMWMAPSFPGKGSTGVSYAEWNVGTPKGKRDPLIIPYKATDTHTILAATYATIGRIADNSNFPGIKGLDVNQYYNTTAGPNRKMRYNTSFQDEAMGIKYGLLSQCLLFTFGLIREGLLDDVNVTDTSVGNAGTAIKKIATHLGIYEKNPNSSQSTNLMKVLDYMYGPHANEVSGSRWPRIKTEYQQAFEHGYDKSTNTPLARFSNLNSKLYVMTHDSMGMVMDSAAIGIEERRANRIGVAGNNAEPGQGLTVILGSAK